MLISCLTLAGCKQQPHTTSSSGDSDNPTHPASSSGVSPAEAARPVAMKQCDLVEFPDFDWMGYGLIDRGADLASTTELAEPLHTTGRYVMAVYEVMNVGQAPETPIHPVLVDAEGRKFTHIEHQEYYLGQRNPTADQRDIQPGISKVVAAIYEVPKSAQALGLAVFSMNGASRKVQFIEMGSIEDWEHVRRCNKR